MDRMEIYNISERYIELINPSSTEKIRKVGEVLGLRGGSRVIEFGSGYGEVLAIWADAFGISGVGIDIRKHVCDRAEKKMRDRGFADRIEIVCGKGADYKFEEGSFDVAACIGASFVFGGYKETILGMKPAVKAGGKLAVGEPYWRTSHIPPENARGEMQNIYTEHELWRMTRDEGYDFEYVVRASEDDWDKYEADNWRGLIAWLEENPEHPERGDVIQRLHGNQEEYLKYGREFIGWAIYVLNPIRYTGI
jgi:SAM-dependent methyltransferase